MRVKFYMKGGHVIDVDFIKNIEMTRDNQTGTYSGYTIEYKDGQIPVLFTLSLPDIVAVHAYENY